MKLKKREDFVPFRQTNIHHKSKESKAMINTTVSKQTKENMLQQAMKFEEEKTEYRTEQTLTTPYNDAMSKRKHEPGKRETIQGNVE